jgi:DNA-binding transcriptional regulator YbjK
LVDYRAKRFAEKKTTLPRSKQTPVSTGTREALILAGERLFAEHGINGVSLRQINTDAGQFVGSTLPFWLQTGIDQGHS